MNVSAAEHRPGRRRADAAILLVLLIGWLALVGMLTCGRRMVTYDTFRDMAWAENIRAGRIWSDPTLAGLPAWYPPGGPLLLSAVSVLTGRPVVDVYGYSSLWLNAPLVVALYLLARAAWDRAIAVVALLTVPLGSVWLLTHAVANVPSVQAGALSLLSLLCWHRCIADGNPQRRGWHWTLLTGLVLALAGWYHPLCAFIPAGAIFLHVVLTAILPMRPAAAQVSPGQVAGRMLVVAAAAGVLSAPLIWYMLRGLPMLNPAPLLYFANDLDHPAYYAHAHAPLIVPAALVGIHCILSRWRDTLWVVAYLLVALAGQGAGYLKFSHGWPVPALLPHEFQWHGHLAIGLCAAVGIVHLARTLALRTGSTSRSSRAAVTWLALLVAATVGPAARWLPRAGMHLLDLEPLLAGQRQLIEWIRSNTTLDAVFAADSDAAYMIVAGLTGRKCVAVPACHSNPRSQARERLEDLRSLLTTADPQEFTRLAARYEVDYWLVPVEPPGTAREIVARYADWPGIDPVFAPRDGTAVVFRVHGPHWDG